MKQLKKMLVDNGVKGGHQAQGCPEATGKYWEARRAVTLVVIEAKTRAWEVQAMQKDFQLPDSWFTALKGVTRWNAYAALPPYQCLFQCAGRDSQTVL